MILWEEFAVDKIIFTGINKEALLCAASAAAALLFILFIKKPIVCFFAALAVTLPLIFFVPECFLIFSAVFGAYAVKCFISRSRKDILVLSTASEVIAFGALLLKFFVDYASKGKIDPHGIHYSQHFALGVIFLFGIYFLYKAVLPPKEDKRVKKNSFFSSLLSLRTIYLFCCLSLIVSFFYCMFFCGAYLIKTALFVWTITIFVFVRYGKTVFAAAGNDG